MDILVQMKWLSLEKEWFQFISGQTQTYLPDGDLGVHLCDLERFCIHWGITLQHLTGLNEEQALKIAKANCRLSNLEVQNYTLSILTRARSGELTSEEAVRLLLSKG
ncbi:hypothetical protein [Neptuniibacter sp. QD48_11]|uniref:hypothetical protein n=1 Tax=Neptuniibacter sp. QD48_11 TaxID=3398211 RepID=UPI0039F63EED